MKGIEGLPLKYLIVILVAAIALTSAIAIYTTFTSSATNLANKTTQTIENKTEQLLNVTG